MKSYSRDETSRKKIILNSKKIIKGMSAEQVLKLLGKPNYDEIVSGKKAGESNYRMLTYYFNIDDLDSVSDGANLSMVCLFSLDGKLIKMISGIPGIKSLAKD